MSGSITLRPSRTNIYQQKSHFSMSWTLARKQALLILWVAITFASSRARLGLRFSMSRTLVETHPWSRDRIHPRCASPRLRFSSKKSSSRSRTFARRLRDDCRWRGSAFFDDEEDFLLDLDADVVWRRGAKRQLSADVAVSDARRCPVMSDGSALRVAWSGRDIRRNFASQIHTPTLTCRTGT